jgi:hypothetical protein
MRHHHTRRSIALVAAGVVGMLVASALPAVAADGPSPVGDGGLLLEEFDDMGGWTALTATVDEWTTADGTVSIDTRGQASGRYIRPTAAVTLPAAYELRTSIRVDELQPQATVSFLLDMLDPANFKTKDLAVQLVPSAGGRVGIQFQAPLGSSNVCTGATPLALGEWAPVVLRRAGGVTAVWIDDQLVASVASPQSGGTLGLGAYKAAYALGPISVDALAAAPEGHPTAPTGCTWTEPPVTGDPGTGTGVVEGDGSWVPASATSSDRPGHEVVAGESTISLDGDWRFATDAAGDGEDEGFAEIGTDVSGWDTLPVPGNWSVHDRYGSYTGTGWYRRTFQTGDLDATAGQRAWLRFGAVYWQADVWLNGQRLGRHLGGYTPFEFDVTNYLVDGENTLVVAADNTFSQGAWWSWGGISRSVALVRTDELVIDRQEIVATPDLSGGAAEIATTVVVRNAGDTDRTVTVSGAVTTADGAAVAATGALAGTATVPAGGEVGIPLTAQLAAGSFALWQLDDPRLYRLDVALAADGDEVHRVSDRFGIRSFVIDGTSMLLNGEKVKLAGANRVSDNPIDGNTEPIDVVRRDLDRMKAAGLDFTRIMHYPQSPELLDYADEIGMLLIAETPVWGGARNLLGEIVQIQHELREMVERDYNHPSVIAYSVANEISSNSTAGIEYDRQMAIFSRQIDPSRYVTQVSNKIGSISNGSQDGSQYMDFVSINMYGGFASGADHAHAMYPDVPIFVSEYSPDGYTFGIDRESVDFRTGTGTSADAFRSRDFVAGWSQWTYNDYRSDYSGSSPNIVRGWGDIDVWGREKRAYDQVQSANAPVSGFALSGVSTTADGGLGLVSITPRGTLDTDGPGYPLEGFRLLVRIADGAGQVVGGTVIDLPTVRPGDPATDVPVSWRDAGVGVTATASLLSPLGYEVAVAETGIRTPAKPAIVSTLAADGAVRVRWTDAAGIGEYHVEARTADGALAAQKDTAELFADLGGLTDGVAYTVTVQAVGGAGRGAADQVEIAPQAGLPLAPQLFELAEIPEGLVLGFSDPTAGAEFEVEVRDAGGSVVQQYTTTNRPGTRIEGLEAGAAYEVRIRRLAGGEPATVWSESLRGVAASAGDAPALDVRGAVTGATAAAVVIEPSDGTERYRVTVDGPGVNRSYDYERAAVDVIPLTGLAADASYTVTVRAVSAGGASSPWSGTVRTGSPVAAELAAPVDLVEEVRGEDVVLTWSPGDDAVVGGYIVTRTWCGETTVLSTTEPEVVIGTVGAAGGTYTVQATYAGVLSDPSEPFTLDATTPCTIVVEIDDTDARDDGSIPFQTSAGWSGSAVTGPGGYASLYADLGAASGASASWTAPALGDVRFAVEAALPDSYAAAGAVYTVHAADGDHVVPIDQGAAKGTWVRLGTFVFDDAHPGSVTLTASGSGYLRASAMRFAPEGATSSPELALSKQTVTAGATVRIDVTGLAPGELVDVELHSDPVLLGEFRADGSGEVHASLGIPAATPAGTHSIVVHAAVSGTATAELQVLAAPGGPAAGPGGLASTGVQLGLLGWAALALLAGILLTASRILRRQRPIPKEFA